MAPRARLHARRHQEERDSAQREANVAVRRALVSRSLRPGESLLLVARKREPANLARASVRPA
jgi:hypothetical protein